jgi:hypothetical protein
MPGKQANAITSYYIRKMRRGDAARKKSTVISVPPFGALTGWFDVTCTSTVVPDRRPIQYKDSVPRSGYAEHWVSYYAARSLVRPNAHLL